MKTRLAESIGEDAALAAYETMLRDLLASIGRPSPEVEIEILWAPTESANGASLSNAFGDLPTAMQTGATLGDRLSMAFSERFFFHATQKIVAIGVDDPSLPRTLIDQPWPSSTPANGSSAPPRMAATTSSAAAPPPSIPQFSGRCLEHRLGLLHHHLENLRVAEQRRRVAGPVGYRCRLGLGAIPGRCPLICPSARFLQRWAVPR